MAVDLDKDSVNKLLYAIPDCKYDPAKRNETAAALSKVAAKAEGKRRPQPARVREIPRARAWPAAA